MGIAAEVHGKDRFTLSAGPSVERRSALQVAACEMGISVLEALSPQLGSRRAGVSGGPLPLSRPLSPPSLSSRRVRARGASRVASRGDDGALDSDDPPPGWEFGAARSLPDGLSPESTSLGF